MRRITAAVFAMALLSLASLPALADTMYARFSTPVRSGRTLSATTIGTLQQGDAVEVGGREESYFRVTCQGQTGYVYYNKLDDKKPEDVSAQLSGQPATQGMKLTEMEAGGALRGLSPMADNYTQAAAIPRWAVDAVEAMQARQVTLQQMEAFQRAGRLGEYGEGGGQ